MDSIDSVLADAAAQTEKFVSRHPRTLTTIVVMALAGFGATAFGIAPLAPDAADLPRHMVTEDVTPEGMDAQLEALAEHALELYRTDLTRATDTPESLLARLNLDDPAAAAFLRTDPTARKVLAGRSGKMVQVKSGALNRLEEMTVRYQADDPNQFATHFTRLRITRGDTGFRAVYEIAPLATQVRLGSGSIRNSLFAATDEARLPDAVATQLVDMFSTDIDFHRELQKGDTFSVIYEALTADGEPITWNQASGRVLAAEFVNNGKQFSAVWFKDPQSGNPAMAKGAYFDLSGHSKRHAFLSSAVEFSRITSGFAMRFHPILNSWRKHEGVDYGAPSGTAVRAVGDGVVDFAGWQNGYGNVIHLKHANDRETVYAHLSRITVKKGQRVDQGAVIGNVGMTGWATGPHLHFEFKLKGVQQNPLTIAKSAESLTLSAAAKPRFAALAQGVRAQLDAAGSRLQGQDNLAE